MKKLLLIALLFSFSLSQAQTVEEIIKEQVRVRATSKQLKEGLQLLEEKCFVTPVEKCNKGKAFLLYLLSERYYYVAIHLINLDGDLQKETAKKALELYDKANVLYPFENITPQNQRMLSEDKKEYEKATE
ncbi:hypothetical protein FORMB_25420 [Formosa sp. Hel1_33_131]|uniref:hypothetical protein n=1 Tax=Formosa sp. Hel1_33_131 TaxID=1336794 RepID=UPI00084E1B23|nr:hypothetical protein [Formosa sp. Hel1_33_131]AOR29559.1 hypothetical protein FORMB_25420 [Formosa sp. Hel1_33_131]